MLIDYTAEEQRQLDAIKGGYKTKILSAESQKKRLQLQQDMQEEMEKFMLECQRKRFMLFAADPAAILKNAKEQAGPILDMIYKDLICYNSPEELERVDGLGEEQGGKFYFYKQFARDYLRDEFTMHIDALKEHPEELAELWACVERAIDNFPFTCKKSRKEEIPGQISLFDIQEQAAAAAPADQNISPLKYAKSIGAVTTIGGYLPFISSKKYMHAFTSKSNPHAYMVNGGADLLRDIIQNTMEPEAGRLDITDDNRKKLEQKARENPVDEPLVAAFFGAARAATVAQENSAELDRRDPENKYTRVYLPKFCRELGIRLNNLDAETAEIMKITLYKDPEQEEPQQAEIIGTDKNNNDFWARMVEVQNYIGVLESNYYVKFVNIVAVDAKTQVLYLDFPYFQNLQNVILNDPDRTVKSKRDKKLVLYEKSYTNELMHASAAGNRNKAGIAIAKLLIDHVLQRGTDPDARLPQNRGKIYKEEEQGVITYHISCAGIVKDIPAFEYHLNNMKSTDKGRDGKTTRIKTRAEKERSILTQQNRALKSAFTTAYNILRTQSDFYKYFVKADVTEVIPTMRQLQNTEIVITHHGKNKKYKKM